MNLSIDEVLEQYCLVCSKHKFVDLLKMANELHLYFELMRSVAKESTYHKFLKTCDDSEDRSQIFKIKYEVENSKSIS